MLRRLLAGLASGLAATAIVVAPQHSAAHADAGVRGGDFVPFTAARVVLDTRSGAVKPLNTTTAVQVLGVGGIPTTGVSAVLAKLTVVPTATTYLTVYPDGAARPGVSMINAGAGETL